MSEKLLFVDDEPNVLSAIERQLWKRYSMETAQGGAEGLAALTTRGPFAVVVSDMRMPKMDGAQFLTKVRDDFPDTVRILLTGYADLRSAIEVVNHGCIFRFLTKPCPEQNLAPALDAALAQYRLVMTERELLNKTLRSCVKVLGEVLALVNPTAFGRAVRAQQILHRIARKIPGAENWEVEVAAVLSQLGQIAIPEAVLISANRGGELDADSQKQLATHTKVARELLHQIPRLDGVLDIISYQDKQFTAPAKPSQEKCQKDIPLGARLLKVVFDIDTLLIRGVPESQAVQHLASRDGWYDPEILSTIDTLIRGESQSEIREVSTGELASGMILDEDLVSDGGVLLLSKGNPITVPLKQRLEATANRWRTSRRIRVLIPTIN